MECYFEIIIYFLYDTSNHLNKALDQGLLSIKKHHETPSFCPFLVKMISKFQKINCVRIYILYSLYEHDFLI